MKKIAAIILAAGKGKRMKALKQNKVVFKLADKHMIVHAIDLLDKLKIKTKIVVVGFAKESVMDVLNDRVVYATQEKRLGTAHAVSCALKKLPGDIQTVLVLNGDDSAFYTEDTIGKLIETHINKKTALSFLTITVDSPIGLGRVMRNGNGNVVGIVEEKDATDMQRKINEINPACYIFEVSFLKKYLRRIKKSSVSGEYYLTSLIDIAIKNNENLEAVRSGKIAWRGINTPEELRKAEELFFSLKN